MRSETLSIRMTPAERKRLDALSAAWELPRADVVRQLLKTATKNEGCAVVVQTDGAPLHTDPRTP